MVFLFLRLAIRLKFRKWGIKDVSVGRKTPILRAISSDKKLFEACASEFV